MHIGRFTTPLAHSLLAALMLAASPVHGSAQHHDDHAAGAIAQPHKPTREESAVINAVRDATARFKTVKSIDGPGEGYELTFGCVSGDEFGAMGLHYVNMALVGDGEIKVGEPEIILFEPTPDGGIRITGADYLVPVALWEANPGHVGPPMLMGQLFHFFDKPNRFGLDPFYALHVWAWKDNPNGAFANWNPDVSCTPFSQKDSSTQ